MNNLQATIVDAFTHGDCGRVTSISNHDLIPRFRPLVVAVIATCSTDHHYAESLFADSEKKAASDELILVLHARYLFAYDPEASDKLWGKIYVIARNPALKKIAQDYLQGTEEEAKAFRYEKVESLRILGNFGWVRKQPDRAGRIDRKPARLRRFQQHRLRKRKPRT